MFGLLHFLRTSISCSSAFIIVARCFPNDMTLIASWKPLALCFAVKTEAYALNRKNEIKTIKKKKERKEKKVK